MHLLHIDPEHCVCSRYQDAVRLWRQYREASEAVRQWADQQLDGVQDLPPEEAVHQVKVGFLN